MNKQPDMQDGGKTEMPTDGGGGKQIDLDRVHEITRRVASRPLKDSRSPKEILDEAWDHHA